MDIWAFQRKLTRRLLGWSLFSITAGFPLWLDTHRPIKNVGQQFLAWGVIDALIAIFGQRSAERKIAREGQSPELDAQQTRLLKKALWFNTGLDIGYILGGAWLFSQDEETKQGHGIGVMIQGGFLFLFDLYHAVRLQRVRGRKE